MRHSFVAVLLAAAPAFAAQDFQPGPTAHFSISAQGQFGNDGGTLNLTAPAGGSVAVGLSSTTMQGASPVTTYTWTANGMSLPCSTSSCSATLNMPGVIALTVTDGSGKSSTAMASVNFRVQSGPRARFTMSGQGQFSGDGGTLTAAPAAGGGINVSLNSVSSSDGAPITGYAWAANGAPLPCSSSACTAFFSAPSNTVTLTVTDTLGQTSTASASVRIIATSTAPAGPVAHFIISGGGSSAGDGNTLNFAAPADGSLSLSLSSTSRAGSSPLTSYAWRLNGAPVCGQEISCSVTLTARQNAITLTATDAEGRSSTASARVNLMPQ